jgi:hypothetical protein
VTTVARLTLKGPNIRFFLYLPVTASVGFNPADFSYPWPVAIGTWDGSEYFAEVDYGDDTAVLVLKWSDGEYTRFELRSGALLKVGLVLRMKSTRTTKSFDITVSELSLL